MLKKLLILSALLLVLPVGISGSKVDPSQADNLQVSHIGSYENIERLGFLPGSFGEIVVRGGYAYTSCPKGLCIIDVSDPRKPKQISFTEIPFGISNIVIDGDYLYDAEWETWRVVIVDIKDPSQPEIVSTLELEQSSYYARVTDLDIHDHRNLYLSLGESSGVERGVYIVDVSDPLDPAGIGFLDVNPDKMETVIGVSVIGDKATILHGKDQWYFWVHGLAQFDITDPRNPVNLWSIEPDYYFGTGGQDITIQSDRVYVVTGGVIPKAGDLYGGLLVYDVSNTPDINTLGEYRVDFPFEELEVVGNYAYLSGDRMDILNVRDPTEISRVGYLNTSGITKLSQKDGTIYFTDRGNGLTIMRYAVSESLSTESGGGLSFEDPIGTTYLVNVPEVAMINPTDIYFAPVVTNIPPSRHIPVGDIFEITAYQNGVWFDGFPFHAQINIWVKYNNDHLGFITDESELKLLWWTGTEWVDAAETCAPLSIYRRDIEDNTLWLPVCEIGRFGLFGLTETVHLPIVSK